MLNVIQYPIGLCFLNRVPEIVMTASKEVLVSLIRLGSSSNVVFSGKYQPDFNSQIRVDLTDILKDCVKQGMPSDESDFAQYGFEAPMCFKVEDGESGSMGEYFTVVNASPLTTVPVEDWCASHFLTNQPAEKPTNYESPEWLTYYDFDGDWVVIGRFYPKEGGAVDMIVKWDEKPGCWSVNVNYARLIPHVARLPHQLKGYYDIILCDGSLNELCRQRYLYEERTGLEKYYLFANPLGGIDTLICQGENVLQPELEHNVGRFGRLYKPLDDTEDMRQWQQNTGRMPYRWRNWLYDLLVNKQGASRYDPKTGAYHGIVVKSSDMGMSDNGQLANASFGYIMDEPGIVMAEESRRLSQSAADSASELDDLTTTVTLRVESGLTDTVVVPSEKVFVSYAGRGLVDYYVNGVKEGSIDTEEVASPAVIDLPYGASVYFEAVGIDALTLNWYEQWHDHYMYNWSGPVCVQILDAYSFDWSQHVCAQMDESYTFAWKEDRCVLQAGKYEFEWQEDRCVLQAGIYDFLWSEDHCVQQYIYKLIWEEMENPEENDNQNI